MKQDQMLKHSEELQSLLDKIIQKEKDKNPYFPFPIPFDDLQKEDESFDDVMGAKGFKISNGYLKKFYDDLKKYKVDEFLNKIGIPLRSIFDLIQGVGRLIIEKSDRPIFIQNAISSGLKTFNAYPGKGLVFQVLLLQGLLEWFEGCDIDEKDKGYNEAQNICNWVGDRLIEAITYYDIIIEKDEHIRPLNEYLSTTQIGKILWEKEPKTDNNIDNGGEFIIEMVKCLLLFKEYGSLFPSETQEKWIERFKHSPIILPPLNVKKKVNNDNNKVVILGMLKALQENLEGLFDFEEYVKTKWGIDNFHKYICDHDKKIGFIQARKDTRIILADK